MSFKANTNRKLKTVLYASVFGSVIGPLFVCIAFGFDIERAVKGFVAGFLISFLCSYFEEFIYAASLKRLRFSFVLLIRTAVYIFVITFTVVMVWVIHESMLNSRSITATISSDDFSHFLFKGDFPYILIFAVTVSFGFNLLLQVRGLLGSGVLFKYLTGKYHKPKIEERFFMFLDLESSTTIAETIGPLKYHSFMNSYFYDINDPIIESKGEIYQYVGDEIVISWSKQNGVLNNNCLRCYYRIREKINSLNEKYIKEFGLIPSFGAGLHFGEVVAGEIGDAKKEIVFHGDVMNTTARILSQAKSLSRPLLISEDAVSLLNPDNSLETIFLDSFLLKGKEIKTRLFYAKVK